MLIVNGKRIVTGKIIIINSGGTDDGSAKPDEILTEAEMKALLNTAEIGSVYKYTGESGIYENGALYIVEAGE